MWVPGMFSFADGATTNHYKYHFVAVFQSLAQAALTKGIKITDEMFAIVVDFSDAQCLGFIDAFVDFASGKPSTTNTLLKGCEYHDDKSVTRVAHIGEVVPSETEAHFKGLCRKMRVTEDEKEFEKVVDILYREWPLISPWLDWWLAPEHGGMIFPTCRKMSAEVANRLPSTTNAEEAMHSTVYKIAGKGNDIIDGFDGLIEVEKYHHNLHDVASGK
ncbi:hypothetical protein K435DRAFT_666205 [Dendrothele bispora CBS 962.96]|uniref:Uncharacterized protein n=1 Tax=Dendrothele bispora (strain CBS 962.96) TaxID=1314807 RepID=A0A4S8M0L5_DENBC|nr:hypothetical protein K435DRAFT_666205 [Dendrothele bispora CBS 962.96]